MLFEKFLLGYLIKTNIMKQVIFSISFLASTTLFAQQQQLSNVWVQNNINPPVQNFRGNMSNVVNDDNNVGNDIQQQRFENVNNPIQIQQSFGNVSNSNKDISFDLSFNSKSSASTSSSWSSSKTNRKTFSKKVSKFKRNFYGKLAGHKKSRHQVDICFNWR